MRPVAAAVNVLPERAKESVYVWSGANEAILPSKLGEVRVEEISRWATSSYPNRRYPAVAVGSSNGALLHLYAGLSIPWLSRTLLIAVCRDDMHPDEPKDDLEWGEEHAPALLEANPDLVLHHLHNANQDRLMIRRLAYFRVKRLRFGETYERFLAQSLDPGGTIFLIDCRSSWPTTRLSDRHVFQHGALGGATQEEFLHGSWWVEDYLKRYGSYQRRWDSPKPDGERPEAKWSFEPALLDDVERFARERKGLYLSRLLGQGHDEPRRQRGQCFPRRRRRPRGTSGRPGGEGGALASDNRLAGAPLAMRAVFGHEGVAVGLRSARVCSGLHVYGG